LKPFEKRSSDRNKFSTQNKYCRVATFLLASIFLFFFFFFSSNELRTRQSYTEAVKAVGGAEGIFFKVGKLLRRVVSSSSS
jgi:hypothetical protein